MMSNSYDNLYLINTSTLEEVCKEYGPGFPYFASEAYPNTFPEGQYPWHWHAYIQCFYIVKGQIDYTLSSGSYRFKAGDGGFINSNALHMLKSNPDVTTIYIEQLFYPTFIGGFAQNDIMTKYIDPITTNSGFDIFCLRHTNPDHEEMLTHLKKAYEYYTDQNDCYELNIRNELTHFWSEFFQYTKDYRDNLGQNTISSRIKPMLLYLNEHYSEKITLDLIASAGSCSTRECNRIFKNNLHTTPFEYLNQIRMNKAVSMLTNTSYSITHIAESCGFSDPSHFTKAFKKIYSISPKQYRSGDKPGINQTLVVAK